MKRPVTYCLVISLSLLALTALLKPWLGQTDKDLRRAQISASLSRLPLSFEINQGQADSAIKFLSRGDRYRLFLTASGATLALHDGGLNAERASVEVVEMKLADADPSPRIEPLEELPGKGNYLIGDDPGQWRTNVANYGRVKYHDVYPGVDLIYYGAQSQLEYDFVLDPGADPRQIKLAFDGAERMSIDAGGDLVLILKEGAVRQRKPVVYQDVDGARRIVEGRYVQTGEREIGFEIGEYDASRPLVIDPVLSYSSYLGGSGFDHGNAVAIDAAGNIYVAGGTGSANFTTANAAQSNFGGAFDCFIAKLNPSGSALIYSTYFGGSGGDACLGMALDSSGNVYLTGFTTSLNFPSAGPIQQSFGGGPSDAFVAKLNANGSSLAYSSYLGGSGSDIGNGLVVDANGAAYVIGDTGSTDFPTKNAVQQAYGGASRDGFVTKVEADGAALAYSTFLGGSAVDQGFGVAVDASGDAYVSGITTSPNFPLANALQQNRGGATDLFVAKLNASGAGLVYSTYLGGSAGDSQGVPGNPIAVDAAGAVYLTGSTTSRNFPTANPLQAGFGGGEGDAFVTKINANGSALVYSTYLGGSGNENITALPDPFLVQDIAVDAAGQAYVTGTTGSNNFPTGNAVQSSFGGGARDAFVTKLSAGGSSAIYSTYLGGAGNDTGLCIAVDPTGSAWISGRTLSTDFQMVNALQSGFGGSDHDAFIVKLAADAVTVSAASFSGAAITSKAIVAAFGPNLATTTAVASSVPLPTTLAGTSVNIRDSAGTERAAPLFFVSQGQVNYQIPDGTEAGPASVTVTSGDGRVSSAVIQVVAAAPSIFTANASGLGAAAAVDAFTGALGPFNAKRANGEPNIISVFGTGLGADATDVDGNASVEVKIDGVQVTALYAGRAPGYVGLNQFNVVFPATISSGVHTLTISRNGTVSNLVTIAIK